MGYRSTGTRRPTLASGDFAVSSERAFYLKKRANFFCTAIDFVSAAHPGVAGHVDLTVIANSDNRRRDDRNRFKRRFFRSIDTANSHTIKRQKRQPTEATFDVLKSCLLFARPRRPRSSGRSRICKPSRARLRSYQNDAGASLHCSKNDSFSRD